MRWRNDRRRTGGARPSPVISEEMLQLGIERDEAFPKRVKNVIGIVLKRVRNIRYGRLAH
jgi:hypothetical protein